MYTSGLYFSSTRPDVFPSIMIDSLRRRSVQTPLQAPRALPSFSVALSIEESRVEENDDKYFVPEATASAYRCTFF